MKIKAVVFGDVTMPIVEGQKNDWRWFTDRKIFIYALRGCIHTEDALIQKVEDHQILEQILKERATAPYQVLFIYGSGEDFIFACQKHFYTLPIYDLDRIARVINTIEYTR